MANIKATVKEPIKLKIMEEYWRNGMNGKQAVMTVLPHVKESTAKAYAHHITQEYKEKTALKMKEMEEGYIATVKERARILTEIARGEQDGVSAKDKITAIKTLNAMDGIGTAKTIVTQNISIGEQKKMIEAKIDKILEGDYKEVDSSRESH